MLLKIKVKVFVNTKCVKPNNIVCINIVSRNEKRFKSNRTQSDYFFGITMY